MTGYGANRGVLCCCRVLYSKSVLIRGSPTCVQLRSVPLYSYYANVRIKYYCSRSDDRDDVAAMFYVRDRV